MPNGQPEHNPAAPAAGQGSAPENQQGGSNAGGVVDPAKKGQDEAAIAGLKADLFKVREQKREADAAKQASDEEKARLNERLTALESELTEAKRAREAGGATPPNPTTPQNQPPDVEATVKRYLDGMVAQTRIQTETVAAQNYVLSRSHFQENPGELETFKQILHAKYGNLLTSHPEAAGRSAYLDWCESKGVIPDTSVQHSQPPSSGVRPSASGGSGSKGKITAQDFASGRVSREEVLKAAREGRYEGAVIR